MSVYIFFNTDSISNNGLAAAVTSPHACQPFFKVEHRQQNTWTLTNCILDHALNSLCHTGRRSHHLVVCYRKRNPYRYM